MAQTRPSAIVQRPMPDDAIKDCTVAELLNEVIERTKKKRRDAMGTATPTTIGEGWRPPQHEPADIVRELSLAITAAEDCLTRHNKAVYMERGVFAITDAEQIPDESATLPVLIVQDSPVQAPSRVAVVAKSSADAKGAARDCGLEDGWVAVLDPEHAIGHHFDKVVYAAGYDRARTTEEALRLRSAVEAAMRS